MQKKLVLISPTSQRLVELFGLDNHKGDIAKRAVYNSLNVLVYGTKIMEYAKPFLQSFRPILKGENKKIALIICLNYNLYIEKVGEIFKMLLELEKVKKELKTKKPFLTANDIIDLILKIYPDSRQIFKFADRKLRNSLAHYSFFIHDNGILYFDESLFEIEEPTTKVIPYSEIIKASVLLNKFVFVLRHKAEEKLKPFKINQEEISKLRANVEDYFNKK